MIHLLRASHANEFELQNYKGIKNLQVITSQHPFTDISLPSTKLWSPTDLPNFPFRRQLLNRLIGGEQWLVGLETLIKTEDIIHSAETYTPYTHQAVEMRKRGVISKLICTCWETIPHNNEKFARLRKWKREVYQYVDIFHTPTERAKAALMAEGVDPKRIVVIPYGVDLTRFKPAKPSKHKRKVVLTIARLEKEKGMEDLEQVAKALPDYDFKVIGHGSYIPKGENITVSTVDYKNIHREYQSADLFFLPSRTTSTWEEQYGMVLVEAMACGLPIVTTSTGAIPEVIGGASITLQECDTQAMAKAIKEILSSKEKLDGLSRLGHARAKDRYDAKKVAIKLAKLYG
jgi:glycosyltransferase involved in cell wall biosynthesis